MNFRGIGSALLLVLGFSAVSASSALAQVQEGQSKAPDCMAYGKPLAVNNDQVLHWKRTTANQFRERGHIQGVVAQVYPDKNGHEHFLLSIGHRPEDTIEVIYNQDFGAVPAVKVGMTAEACGDYITSTAQSGPYPPSPAGAIIHWVHRNPKHFGHEDGFMMLDGKLYGADFTNAGPKAPRRPNELLETFGTISAEF